MQLSVWQMAGCSLPSGTHKKSCEVKKTTEPFVKQRAAAFFFKYKFPVFFINRPTQAVMTSKVALPNTFKIVFTHIISHND